MRIVTILHTIITRILLLASFLLAAPFFLVIALLPRHLRFSNKIVFWIVHFFYHLSLKCTLLPIKYIWQAGIPQEPVIFIANHQSSLDVPLAGLATGGHPHVWLARGELMQTWLLRLILPIFSVVATIGNAHAAASSLLRIFRILNKTQAHLMIFPEGSRSLDGRLQHFYDGFILMAKKTNRAVVPLYIHNVHKIYPRTSFWIRYHPVTVIVGPAFRQGPDESDHGFKSRILDWFHAAQRSLSN